MFANLLTEARGGSWHQDHVGSVSLTHGRSQSIILKKNFRGLDGGTGLNMIHWAASVSLSFSFMEEVHLSELEKKGIFFNNKRNLSFWLLT